MCYFIQGLHKKCALNFIRSLFTIGRRVRFQPINAKSYYEHLPTIENACGDIWIGLPSMGLFESATVTGIVISPACDVGNFKTETITYLPITPVMSYFSTIGHLPVVRREVAERFRAAGYRSDVIWPDPGYQPPKIQELEREERRIQEYLRTEGRSKPEKEHLPRALAGLRVAKACSLAQEQTVSPADISKLYGSKWAEVKKQIIGNSFRSDLHFLPQDDQGENASVLESHCVVLFRYPITVPSEIMSAAQIYREDQWRDYVKSYGGTSKVSLYFSDRLPLKSLSLKPSFLADLLNRFTSLYSRVGSPDFSSSVVEKYSLELDNG